MRYGDICTGISAASVAWRSLGWTAAWFAEIDPFASSVLAHRFGARIAFVDSLPLPVEPVAEAIVRANMPRRASAEREAVA